MSRSAQLVQRNTLLRSFRLPVEASVADLKQAYLRDAKRLHPDLHPDSHHKSSTQAFAELQARFEEARSLLEKPLSPHPGVRRDERAWSRRSAEEFYGAAEAQSVPVVGSPPSVVYAFALAATAVGTLLITALTRRDDGSAAGARERASERRIRAAANPEPTSIPEPSSASDIAPLGSEGRDATSYYKALSSPYRRTKTKTDPKTRPQMRDGVALTSAHVAAEDSNIWHIERCAASKGCRLSLTEADRRGDTPLHRCANFGQFESCRALLRVGADPLQENKWHLRPMDLAEHQGHSELVELLQMGESARLDVRRHADGLGLMSRLPAGMYYIGPYHSAALRNAINYAAGKLAVIDIDFSTISQGDSEGAAPLDMDARTALAVKHVRSYLNSTDVDIDETRLSLDEIQSIAAGDWGQRRDDASLVGFLVFEPPGVVTKDAQSHWSAIRPGMYEGQQVFYRLDVIRGTFRMTEAEFSEFLRRYPVWRVWQRQESIGQRFARKLS